MYINNAHINDQKKQDDPPQRSLIYDTMLRPFIEPFLDITFQTMPKILLGIALFIFMVIGTIQDLIETPQVLWVGLIMLALLDFAAGTVRAIFDKEIKFNIHRWARTAYKLTTYMIVIITTSVAGNMYSELFGWVQYAVIAMLVALEMFSIARHFKMTALVYAVIRIAQTGGTSAGKDFGDIIDEMDKNIREKKRKETFRKDHVDEVE